MKALAQQIRNELRTARVEQRNAEHNAISPVRARPISPLAAGYYDGRARALQDRRRVLGYLYLTMRAFYRE